MFHIFYANAEGKRIGSGSSFTANGYLITNGHVFDCPPGTAHIWIRRDEHTVPSQGVYLRKEDFERRLVVASPAHEHDYAVLDVPELHKLNPYQFKLIGHSQAKIGQQIVFLGYPFEKDFLTAHSGIISSTYSEHMTTIIQVDASVNNSNSGGPLLDVESGNVIGIVTRKATGLTDMFKLLRKTVEDNVNMLSSRSGVQIMGIDYTQELAANQRRFLHLLHEIERSANVGIGYAFSSIHVIEDPTFQERLAERGV